MPRWPIFPLYFIFSLCTERYKVQSFKSQWYYISIASNIKIIVIIITTHYHYAAPYCNCALLSETIQRTWMATGKFERFIISSVTSVVIVTKLHVDHWSYCINKKPNSLNFQIFETIYKKYWTNLLNYPNFIGIKVTLCFMHFVTNPKLLIRGV